MTRQWLWKKFYGAFSHNLHPWIFAVGLTKKMVSNYIHTYTWACVLKFLPTHSPIFPGSVGVPQKDLLGVLIAKSHQSLQAAFKNDKCYKAEISFCRVVWVQLHVAKDEKPSALTPQFMRESNSIAFSIRIFFNGKAMFFLMLKGPVDNGGA